jgi:hypothetical protein
LYTELDNDPKTKKLRHIYDLKRPKCQDCHLESIRSVFEKWLNIKQKWFLCEGFWLMLFFPFEENQAIG